MAAARDCNLRFTVADALAGYVKGYETRGARCVEREAGPAEIEEVG